MVLHENTVDDHQPKGFNQLSINEKNARDMCNFFV